MKTKFRMRTPTDVRRVMNRVANMVAEGQIEPKAASAIVYAANAALKSIDMEEQAVKIKDLQALLMQIEERQRQ